VFIFIDILYFNCDLSYMAILVMKICFIVMVNFTRNINNSLSSRSSKVMKGYILSVNNRWCWAGVKPSSYRSSIWL